MSTPATTHIVFNGIEVLSIKGVYPPDVLRHLSDQRVSLPSVDPDKPAVIIYRRHSRVIMQSYIIDLETYRQGAYTSMERISVSTQTAGRRAAVNPLQYGMWRRRERERAGAPAAKIV